MARIDRSALVPYSPDDMFALVAAVERYPAFLPWCASASVLARRGDGLDALIALRFMGVEQQFSTRNLHKPPGLIQMQLLDGPFEYLQGEWRFDAMRAAPPGEQPSMMGTRIFLMLDYAMKSGALARLFAPAFDRIAAQMMDAFLARADALYSLR